MRHRDISTEVEVVGMQNKRSDFNRNIVIVKRVSGDRVNFECYPSREAAQTFVDAYNHQNINGHAIIDNVTLGGAAASPDDTVRF